MQDLLLGSLPKWLELELLGACLLLSSVGVNYWEYLLVRSLVYTNHLLDMWGCLHLWSGDSWIVISVASS